MKIQTAVGLISVILSIGFTASASDKENLILGKIISFDCSNTVVTAVNSKLKEGCVIVYSHEVAVYDSHAFKSRTIKKIDLAVASQDLMPFVTQAGDNLVFLSIIDAGTLHNVSPVFPNKY
jgi:hypothetical protein